MKVLRNAVMVFIRRKGIGSSFTFAEAREATGITSGYLGVLLFDLRDKGILQRVDSRFVIIREVPEEEKREIPSAPLGDLYEIERLLSHYLQPEVPASKFPIEDIRDRLRKLMRRYGWKREF